LDVATTVEAAAERVRGRYYDVILIDCRNLEHPEANPTMQLRAALAFLETLRLERDRERRFPMSRVAVFVSDTDVESVEKQIFAFGQHHIGACIRDRTSSPFRTGDAKTQARNRFVERLWQFCNESLVGKPSGKKSLCLAGGGLAGIYYELGVLKCLNDAFGGFDIRDFDMFFGVSAGAMVAGFLANGVPVDELIHNVGDLERTWPYKLEVGWRHLNLTDIPHRVGRLKRNVVSQVKDAVRGKRDFSVASLVSNYGVLFGPMFDNKDIERMLRHELGRPKRSNDFRRLKGKLFIGATDQDRRDHVLFGDEGRDDVPISVAIQASTATHPFFPSVQVQGRYYTDGGVTRTSNIGAAIKKGSTFVIVIDPYVPLISEEAGFNARQGNLWLVQQDFRTIAYTRFEQVTDEILRQNPQVSCFTFVPSNRMRERMTESPITAQNFHAIVTEAYSSAYRRLALLEYKLAPEMENLGIRLDLSPVAARVELLMRQKSPDANALLT